MTFNANTDSLCKKGKKETFRDFLENIDGSLWKMLYTFFIWAVLTWKSFFGLATSAWLTKIGWGRLFNFAKRPLAPT